ncbi:hypothetical protein [Tianweitania sediminis]|uniref:hypothetical protein n=1 Tax=Tianweitania sediminis TaxID=1502156 RepID=UPI001FD734F2|nr:hypothetical protein [Tianweitania sediminis]
MRKPGQATQAILVDQERRYVGKAAVTFNLAMRERLWERVKARPGAMPEGLPKDVQREKADWLQPDLPRPREVPKGRGAVASCDAERGPRGVLSG